ncbi:MAG: hypothetical protein JXK94_07900 [Deltaproteobacteria bacterium]|nr:hypothetical protein [Deltaproteobacteria bacterium]
MVFIFPSVADLWLFRVFHLFGDFFNGFDQPYTKEEKINDKHDPKNSGYEREKHKSLISSACYHVSTPHIDLLFRKLVFNDWVEFTLKA